MDWITFIAQCMVCDFSLCWFSWMMLSHRSMSLCDEGVSDSSKSQSWANETAGRMKPLRGCGTGRWVSGLKQENLKNCSRLAARFTYVGDRLEPLRASIDLDNFPLIGFQSLSKSSELLYSSSESRTFNLWSFFSSHSLLFKSLSSLWIFSSTGMYPLRTGLPFTSRSIAGFSMTLLKALILPLLNSIGDWQRQRYIN